MCLSYLRKQEHSHDNESVTARPGVGVGAAVDGPAAQQKLGIMQHCAERAGGTYVSI